MRYAVKAWLDYLHGTDAVFGGVLAIAGICFLLMGWRFQRLSMAVSYVMICAAAGTVFGPSPALKFLYAVVAGGAGFAIAWGASTYSPALLAGTLGALGLWLVLGDSTIPPPTSYIFLGISFMVIGAFGAMEARGTAIVVTSFVGAALFVSGLVATVAASRTFLPHFRSMSNSSLFYPFLLLVPTVMGVLLQFAAAKRQDCGEISG